MITYLPGIDSAVDLGLSDQFIGKVVDTETKEVVGCTEIMGSDVIAARHKDLRQFIFTTSKDDNAIWRVYAISPETALLAIGLGNAYQEEYGDYWDLIHLIQTEAGSVELCAVQHMEVPHAELLQAYARIITK